MSEKKPSEVLELQSTSEVTRVIRGRKLLEYLDAEHARRAAFEQDTLKRLDILERSQRDVLTRLPTAVDHSALTGLVGEDRPAPDAATWLASVAVRCSERLPEPEQRVLFFVPSHANRNHRWRAGMYVCPPLYAETEWKDEESEVGDVGIRWRPEQVTHWMPMPGDPK